MATVKFYRKADGLILLSYIPKPNPRIKISTGLHCPAGEWNKKRQRATGSGKFQGNASLNALLDRIRDVVTGLDAECRLHYQRPPTRAEVKAAVYQATGRGVEQERETTLLAFFRACVEEKKKSLSSGRVRQYAALMAHLEAFGKDFYPVAWGNLNARFAADFEDFSFRVLGHANNTFVKHITLLKTLMRDAVQHEHITEADYKAFRALWKGQKEDVPTLTYLTPEELERLWSADLPARLAKARDRAMAQAFTGVRNSDLDDVRESNISPGRDYQGGQDLELISIVQDKTRTLIKIPLHPYVRVILSRNGGKVPELSAQKYNRYLKELCQAAGIDAPVTIVRNRAGKKEAERGPKWQFVTSHILRATAATNLYAMGVPESTIMAVLGWKKREVFQRYIRLAKEAQAGIVARSAYFQAGK